jgi:hypothetical protein
MYTFILSAILGIIVSWCLYGKNFSKELTSVALTVVGVIFGATLIASSISISYLPTETVFSRQNSLIPEYYNTFPKDTSIRKVTYTKKGTKIQYNKIDTVINYDSIPQYFIIDKDGEINYLINNKGDISKESHYLSNITIRRINNVSWYGIKHTNYVCSDSKWVTDLSLPTKYTEHILYLGQTQYHELVNRIAKYNKDHDANSQLVINK